MMDVPNHGQVKLVAYKLKGDAVAWWDILQNNKRRHKKVPILKDEATSQKKILTLKL